jgi:hypothetical protein
MWTPRSWAASCVVRGIASTENAAASSALWAGRSGTWPSTTRLAWSTRRSSTTRTDAPRRLFLVRAVRWFREHGIAWIASSPTTAPLQIQGVATRLLDGRALPPPDRPPSPQTNSKAERWIQTALRECLHLEVFTAARNDPLASSSSSGGTMFADLTAPTTGSRPALASLRCRRRECYQCRGGVQLDVVSRQPTIRCGRRPPKA